MDNSFSKLAFAAVAAQAILTSQVGRRGSTMMTRGATQKTMAAVVAVAMVAEGDMEIQVPIPIPLSS